jgi:tetratricopeptide (TPR) repeat protein
MQKYDEALKSLDQALAINSSLSDAHYARGLNLLSKGQAADAGAAFTKALSKKTDPRYSIGLGRALLAQKQHKEALKTINGVISRHPDVAEAYIYRSSAYHGLGEKRKAGDDLTKAVTIAPNDPSIRAYYEHRRYGKAPVFYETKTDVDALSAPKAGAPVYQKLAEGTSVYSPSCDTAGWCRVMFGETLAGYVQKSSLSLISSP